jgi:hypothetical protein
MDAAAITPAALTLPFCDDLAEYINNDIDYKTLEKASAPCERILASKKWCNDRRLPAAEYAERRVSKWARISPRSQFGRTMFRQNPGCSLAAA